ncbi:MAG: TolC family outer membrane protein [Magnetococcales bacterium]|nr:TolC family outer membrane protein [Magnetococcales bacterium]
MNRSGLLTIAGVVGLFALSGEGGAVEKPLSPFFRSVQEALASNGQIKQAQARLDSALTLYPQARSAILPTLSLGWSSSYEESRWKGGNSDYDPTTMSLSLSQPLFNQQAFEEMRRVEPLVMAFEQDLEAARQGVYFSLIQISTALLEAREVALLAKNNLDVTKRHLEATKARFSVGEVTKTDVSQARARVATAEADWIRRVGEGKVNEAQFQEIAGIAVPEGLQVPLVQSQLPNASLAILTPLAQNRPDIQAARYRLEADSFRVQAKKAGHYPTLSLSSSGSRTWDPASSSVVGPVDSFSLSVSASLPLYSGGLTTAQTQQAQSDESASRAGLDLLQEKAVRELKQVLSKYQSAKASDEALKTAVAAAKEAKEGVDQEYEVGSRTSLDLLDAQNELFSTQTEQVKSQFAVNLALFELLKVVGKLTPEGEGFQLVSPISPSDALPIPLSHEESTTPSIVTDTGIVHPVVSFVKPRWTVQVAAFRGEEGAEKFRAKWAEKGAELFTQTRVDKENQTWYLLRLGRFKDKADAQEAQRAFKKRFAREGFVTTLIPEQ